MESILVSQSATKDISKNAEPPPKLIFCCLRNLRYSTVLTTFCIEPNNTIVEGTFLFRREKKNSPPGHVFLGRNIISKHMKGKTSLFKFPFILPGMKFNDPMFAASDSVGRALDISPRAKCQLCPTNIRTITRQPDEL